MSAPVDIVLFDLGGVLIEVPGVEAMVELTGLESGEEVWRRWLSCRWVRLFESGGCSEADFATGLVEDWGLAIGPGEFLDGFGSWATDPLAGAVELVTQTAQVVAVGCLSNTNAVHWDSQLARSPLTGLFAHTFLSFQTGYVKPDKAAFDHVVAALGVPAERIVFLDDNLVNVEGAQGAGMRALHARGVDEARRHLVEAGLLPALSETPAQTYPLGAGRARSVAPTAIDRDYDYHGALVVIEVGPDEIVLIHPPGGPPDAPASLPSNPCAAGESPEDGAVRMAREMTGLDVEVVEEFVSFIQPGTPTGAMYAHGFLARSDGAGLLGEGPEGPVRVYRVDDLPGIVPVRVANQKVLAAYLARRENAGPNDSREP